ncbi:MAG: hypothetical protein GY747_04185 [Planctomycetes bacterium]|nr:hypothetical protein [Planctomycetota bacterium]MCP4770493.1 hypothetical protein [Planctomycetota bacterium]MCP4859933.1 hypothetical protein [Planctomycetota bacterium]
MPTMLAAFVVFVIALTAMAIGVLLSGRKLAKSCGGLADAVEGDLLGGDCVCSRKDADICASDEGNEMVLLAELGNPKRKDYFRSSRENGGDGGAAQRLDEFNV